MKVSKKSTKSSIGLYFLIFIYICLPRVTVTNNSWALVLFANLKNIFPTIASLIVCLLNQRPYQANSFLKVNDIMLGLYILYVLVNVLQLALINL